MDLSFQEQKTERFYLNRIKFYCKERTKKLHRFKKCSRTVKRTVKKNYALFVIAWEPVVIS
jgi:hypothetical protein